MVLPPVCAVERLLRQRVRTERDVVALEGVGEDVHRERRVVVACMLERVRVRGRCIDPLLMVSVGCCVVPLRLLLLPRKKIDFTCLIGLVLSCQ